MWNPFRRSGKEKKIMEKENVKHEQELENPQQTSTQQAGTADMADSPAGSVEQGTNTEAELDILRTEHQALHDKHLRLFAEFDNFRKRTARERLELIQFAGENSLKAVLPVLDDLSRAIANNETATDIDAVKEGFKLIHQKLYHILAGQGLKQIDVKKGDPFDTDKHEAITRAPIEDEKLKGAVIDVIESGYMLHEKVIRYAKVVVGE